VFQRFIYALALYLLTPFALYRLTARGIKYHGYFARWRERFGFFPTRTSKAASGFTPSRSARSTRRCR
jgi:3-deoxy-D-manno-octulosonic-acid transferase